MTTSQPKKRRRVTTAPVPGSDPTPGASPNIGSEGEGQGSDAGASAGFGAGASAGFGADRAGKKVTPESEKTAQDLAWYEAQQPPHWGVKR